MEEAVKRSDVEISKKKVMIILSITGLSLITGNIITLILRFKYEYNNLWGFARLLSFDRRDTLSHYYISTLLLISALLLFLISISHKSEKERSWIHWSVLSFVLMMMSLDKLLWIRELAIQMLFKVFSNMGIGNPSREILKITVLIIFITTFLRFFLLLPSRIRFLFLAAGVIFVGGELGGDFLSHQLYIYNDSLNVNYTIMSTIEESMEMLGISIFIFALLGYLAEFAPRKRFYITSRQ